MDQKMKSVYTDSEPGRVYWGADEELSDGGSPRVIVYGYDGLPMQPVALPSPDYVSGPEHPPSPDYVPGPEHPHSHVEDQPLPADASPTALSLGYVADSDPNKDPKEDPEEDHADYPADGGDGDDEPFDDDDDGDDNDDEDEDDDEEEEHLALADSFVVSVVDPVPLTRDIEAFESDKARKTIRLEPTMSASIEARIAKHAAAPTPPLPMSSPPLPLPSPLTTGPTDAGVPLGYRAARIRMRALLPSTSHRIDILKVEMSPRKRACFTTSAPRLEVGESLAAGAARQSGPTLEADLRQDRVEETGYGITDTWDEILEAKTEEFQIERRHMLIGIWTGSEDRSAAIEAHVKTLEAQVATLIAQTSSLQAQLTTALGRIETLKARDLKPQDGPAEAGSRC
ncbi:hypothetical protein Tco_0526160 [Tanacetum coccineum]